MGGCLETEWKLLVEYVMRNMYVCNSHGDWLNLAPHEDTTTFSSHSGFLKPLPQPLWETRIHPSPLHPLLKLEVSDSSHNILEILISSRCLFKLLLDFLRWVSKDFKHLPCFNPYWISSTIPSWVWMGHWRAMERTHMDLDLVPVHSVSM